MASNYLARTIRRATGVACCLFALTAAGVAPAAPVTPLDCALPGDSHCEAWTASVSIGGSDFVSAGAASPSGDRFFIAGRGNATTDYQTMALSASGAVLWQRKLVGGAIPMSVVVSPDGATVAVAGQQNGVGGADFAVVAYDTATGTQRWVARYDGGSYDWALDIVSAPDGSVFYATGATQGPGGYNDVDYLTIAVNGATGAVLWSKRSGGANLANDNPLAIAISPDGETVAVTGWWAEDFIGSPPVLRAHYGNIAYDSATGTVLWQRRFSTPGTTGATGIDLAFSPDSTLLHVTGSAQRPNVSATLSDFATVTYDVATGGELWTARYNACRQCHATSIAVGPDGTVYVSGDSVVETPTAGVFDFASVAYDGLTGENSWVFVYDGLSHQLASNNVLSPDGETLYVSGMTQTNVGLAFNHLTTIAIDTATGTMQWDARYGLGSIGATNFNPSKPIMAAAPGRLYLAATGGLPGATDFFAAAYDD